MNEDLVGSHAAGSSTMAWRIAASVGAAAVSMALAACGGGDGGSTAGESSAAVRPLSLAASAQAAALPISTATLFDWAQIQFPTLFPAGPVNQPLVVDGVSYTIRYYAATNNYLGESGGRIYGYGTFTGFQLQGFGFSADYTCQAAPGNCQPATGLAMAWDASRSWDGSDWQ